MPAKNLYLPDDVIAFAEKQAGIEHRSMSNYIAMLIRQEKDRLGFAKRTDTMIKQRSPR